MIKVSCWAVSMNRCMEEEKARAGVYRFNHMARAYMLSWLSWLERRSHIAVWVTIGLYNPEITSSTLVESICFYAVFAVASKYTRTQERSLRLIDFLLHGAYTVAS